MTSALVSLVVRGEPRRLRDRKTGGVALIRHGGCRVISADNYDRPNRSALAYVHACVCVCVCACVGVIRDPINRGQPADFNC